MRRWGCYDYWFRVACLASNAVGALRLMRANALIRLSCVFHLIFVATALCQEQQNVRVFGFWEKRCGYQDAYQNSRCGLFQRAKAIGDASSRISVIVVRKYEEDIYIVRVLAPLGVLLLAGVTMFVDGREIGKEYFNVCMPGDLLKGCIAEFSGTKYVNAFKSGRKANLIIYDTPNKYYEYKIGLLGFSDGITSLPHD